MAKHLFVRPELCTGCNRCVYICSAIKEDKFFPEKSRIRINNFTTEGFSFPSICFHCVKADCEASCPEDAIYRTSEGRVLVDHEKCNGCGICVDACPYGMIFLEESGKAYKCDLCGGKPACVDECHPKAIVFVDDEKDLIKQRLMQMKKRKSAGTAKEKRHAIGFEMYRSIRG